MRIACREKGYREELVVWNLKSAKEYVIEPRCPGLLERRCFVILLEVKDLYTPTLPRVSTLLPFVGSVCSST